MLLFAIKDKRFTYLQRASICLCAFKDEKKNSSIRFKR